MGALVVALVLLSSGIAVVDASPSVIETSNGYHYTPAEAREAIRSYQRIATDHNFTMYTELTPAGEMPAWDPIAHYVGLKKMPNGESVYNVWLNERYRRALDNLAAVDPSIATQILSAMLMVAMDGGLAGPRWKSMFADATHRDLLQAPGVSDPYKNRHALVALLAQDRSAYATSMRPEGVVGLTGSVLTKPIKYSSDLVGFAQAGIGAGRMTEFLDDQRALAEPDAQHFIDDWFSHFEEMLPTENARTFLKQQRSLLVVDASFDRQRSSQAFVQAMQSVANQLSASQTGAFLIGLYAEEAGYNAALTKDTRVDSFFRGTIAQDSALDATMPKMAAMRQHLAGLNAGDWEPVKKQSAAIVSYILSGR
ncbi:MAG TPA: hypothetical protein VN934_11875 [Candidatus Tumulicola sp.]|nr:hypothetical protein [Candidatus Tumulicola sp.]